MFSRDVLDSLFAEGEFWTPATNDDYDLLLEGIAENTEAVRQDMEDLGNLRNPWKTPILSDLEKEYAVTPSATATEAQRRQRLAAQMFAKNTLPTYDVLQEKLQSAGFDCYVWPNDPVTDPAEFLDEAFQLTCGDILPSGNDGQCGEPDAFCACIGGELLVNGEQFEQLPNFTVQCDEALAQCGEPDALAGQYDSIQLIPIEYDIPTEAGYWPLIFFVGGERDVYPKYGTGTDYAVYKITIQADGKIIVGGYFTAYNGTSRNSIARLNTDGSSDATFDPGTGVMAGISNGVIRAITIQADGKILIGGAFTAYNGTSRNSIARLNTDGSLDATFDPGTGANDVIWDIAIQTDGKIVIGGQFTTYNGTGRNRIVRINTDGSLDATFNPGTGANQTILALSIQGDGKIIAGGVFTTYNGTGRNRIVRINTDGSLDATFNPGTGANDEVYALSIQGDGKIIAGGAFTTYNGTGRNRIVRINTDGSLDATFNSGTLFSYVIQSEIIIQGDGKIIAASSDIEFIRLESDGSLDTSFDSGIGTNGNILALSLQADGNVIIGGLFSYYNGILRYNIVRINTDGSIDTNFNYGLSIASAYIPIERRLEFRRLILKYKPLHTWAGLIVVYS
ncbi:MAG: hypothetical protein PVG39_02785 [Desulfobacteraceae bacterium]|jgi:uncharacterized delta-60 repeat protein